MNSRPIAALPWSAIRRVGQSRLLSLTIVVPFLGSLLLFNQHVVEILTLSPDLVRRWLNIPIGGAEDVARKLTLSRLYYVYFGLTFLGFGSALFTLFCPAIVRSYASAVECVQVESALVTRSRIALLLSEVSYRYVDWLDMEMGEPREVLKRMGEPAEFRNLCSVAMVEIFSDLPSDLFVHTQSSVGESSPEGDPSTTEAQTPALDDDDPFYDRRGRPDPYMIAKALTSGHRRLQWFLQAFQKEAGSESHRNDVLLMNYMALDNTRPRLRVLVAFFYGAGFALLAIPTLITFAQLSWHIAVH